MNVSWLCVGLVSVLGCVSVGCTEKSGSAQVSIDPAWDEPAMFDNTPREDEAREEITDPVDEGDPHDAESPEEVVRIVDNEEVRPLPSAAFTVFASSWEASRQTFVQEGGGLVVCMNGSDALRIGMQSFFALHHDVFACVSFSPEGENMGSFSFDFERSRDQSLYVRSIHIRPDGEGVVLLGGDGVVHWANKETTRFYESKPLLVRFHAERGRRWTTLFEDLAQWGEDVWMSRDTGDVFGVGFSERGGVMFALDEDGERRWEHTISGATEDFSLMPFPITARDGAVFAVFACEGPVQIDHVASDVWSEGGRPARFVAFDQQTGTLLQGGDVHGSAIFPRSGGEVSFLGGFSSPMDLTVGVVRSDQTYAQETLHFPRSSVYSQLDRQYTAQGSLLVLSDLNESLSGVELHHFSNEGTPVLRSTYRASLRNTSLFGMVPYASDGHVALVAAADENGPLVLDPTQAQALSETERRRGIVLGVVPLGD